MYRGRPPPRGGYPPPFEGRGPPPPRPYLAPGYRDDRSRARPPYHPEYHDQAHPDSFRRSPPRKRYPSPGSGSHRGGEYWAGGPPRERSPSPRGPIPLDHNLIITVGNELTGPSGSVPSRHRDRDFPPRPNYEPSRSRDRSPDRRRAKSRGRSKSRPRSRSRSSDRSRARSRSRTRSPDRSRARSRSRTRSPDRSRARSRGRSKSRPRSQSRSPDRSRARSRGRSKSRPRSHSRSPDRSRAKSRGRSKSRPRSHSRSPDRSRAKSRGRSRSRSRGRSRGRIYSKAASRNRSKSRQRSQSRSRSASSSSSSTSCSLDYSEEKSRKEFRELETARRRRELEEMLSLPTKSILKKRNDCEDSPLLRRTDSARALEGSSISRVADQLLQAVKGLEPHRVASMLSELQSDPQMAQRAGLDAEIKEILSLLGGQAPGAKAQEKTMDDIDDEEKFLYGDSEEPKPPAVSEPVRHQALDLYGDVTEETLYGDYPPQTAIMPQTYGVPSAAPPNPQVRPTPEVDVRYVSPTQNITVQVSNPAYPPGTEPLEESERQALEEYEKIQDLLKTIGLDLGVAEISKMAARTKERLQGNRPPPKTPTRRRHYSSGSSDGSPCSRGGRRRSHSRSSSSSSRSRSCGSRGSWSCDNGSRKTSAPPRSYKDRDVKETKAEWRDAEPPPQLKPEPNTLPSHPGVPIPTYPPSHVHGMVAPNFPPPGYGQYGNYLPYMHQQWPPMFPSPNLSLPPQGGPSDFPPALPCKGPYIKADPVSGAKGLVKSCVQDGEKGKASSCDKRSSEEQNNESQKQKVLEEREKLKQERDIRMKKKEYLMKELERLRKQQGELLRKKRREKGGHKDPLLQEISHLQEEVMTQISNLRKEHEVAEKKRNELEKVALILGLSPSDRPRRTSTVEQEDKPPPPSERGKRERSPEGRQAASSSMIKQTSAVLLPSRASPDKPSVTSSAPPPAPPPDPFEYYDAGNHWCKNCNVTSGSMFDFFTHLHSKTHRKTLDPYDRPWASTPTKTVKNTMSEEKLTKPAKGSEFLLPVRGFFCLLCKEFYGDAICAEEHVTTHAHNEKYKKQMYENPLYEQRRNLDRQAGLASEMSGKKRKHEDDEKGNKDKEEKSKHKKDKKDKEKQKEETDTLQKEERSKVKKEEEEKLKPGKKEDFKEARILEEERPSHSKKDEDEKCKYSRKDDKYRYSREEEERTKYSRRDEEDRYKHSREEEYRYRYRREEDVRHDDRFKYGLREDDDKHKSSKNSDFTYKYDKERDEGKPKSEREAFKKLEAGNAVGRQTAEVSKLEPPIKPYNLSKIMCGPNPAMRAKLRKQSLEAGKPASMAMTPSFGKFTWKKRESALAKEAQEVAAEFIKDDEAAVKQNPVSVEDSFAKSVAVAKEIAQKLGGQQNMPLPQPSDVANRGRIRPNLPAPTAVLRKTAMMGKPAPLNAFLSIRPQNTSLVGSPPKDGPRLPGLNTMAQNAPLEAKPEPPIDRARPTLPALATVTPKPFEAKPVTTVSKPAKIEAKPLVSEDQLSPSVAKPAQPAIVKIVSDVAAPGVPESEQTHTVFVKPPPFLALSDGGQKSEKLKSNLAAAKAQELFGIFYSSVGQSGTSSITKPAADNRASSSTNKSHLPAPQAQKPQPQSLTESQPSTGVCTPPHPDPNPPIPQTHPKSNIHIASVWSLQSTQTPAAEVAPSKTISQATHPKQSPPPLSEAQSVHQNHSSFPKSESEIAPQMEPAELDQTPQTQPKLIPQNQTEPQSEPEPDQHTQPSSQPQAHPDAAPESDPKPGPKIRGKTTPTKRTTPDLRPVRQTRSQTRYQTRQQQSQSEPEPASGDSDTVVSDLKDLDTIDLGSGIQPGEGALNEGSPQVMVITPETPGLPSEMASLDFESDFNFE